MTEIALNESSNAPSSPKKNRTLIVLLTVAILPVVLAYGAFFTGLGVPTTTVNAGQLLTQVQSLETLLTDADWRHIQQQKKWRLLLPLVNSCDEQCVQNLYTTRQVHIRLSEKGSRVERVALVSSDTAREKIETLKVDHPYLKVFQVETENWQQWQGNLQKLQDLKASTHYYYLVDQEGRAMMAYDQQHIGNALLKDLKRALKYSIDYQ